MLQVMGFIYHVNDRPLALFHQVAQIALPPFGLFWDLHLRAITRRQVVKQGFNQRWQRGTPFVGRQRFGERDLAGFGKFGFDAAQKVCFPRTNKAGDHDKLAGLDGRANLANKSTLMFGLEVARPLERSVEALTGLDVCEYHSSLLRIWNRSRIRTAIVFLSSVSVSS